MSSPIRQKCVSDTFVKNETLNMKILKNINWSSLQKYYKGYQEMGHNIEIIAFFLE